jgi:hypothetical protein
MPAIFNSLEALSSEIAEMGNFAPEYWDKQCHVVSKSRTVEREKWLIERCTKKTVLHIGCTGPLDAALRKVATRCYGIDALPLDRPDYTQLDLDEWMPLPVIEGIDLILCGEVLEHLGNPLSFLARLHTAYPSTPVYITVPNAFNLGGQEWLVKRGRENVNKDHVCYYSYTTLKELLRRAEYGIREHYWYGGRPYVSEGLIVVAEAA